LDASPESTGGQMSNQDLIAKSMISYQNQLDNFRYKNDTKEQKIIENKGLCPNRNKCCYRDMECYHSKPHEIKESCLGHSEGAMCKDCKPIKQRSKP